MSNNFNAFDHTLTKTLLNKTKNYTNLRRVNDGHTNAFTVSNYIYITSSLADLINTNQVDLNETLKS